MFFPPLCPSSFLLPRCVFPYCLALDSSGSIPAAVFVAHFLSCAYVCSTLTLCISVYNLYVCLPRFVSVSKIFVCLSGSLYHQLIQRIGWFALTKNETGRYCIPPQHGASYGTDSACTQEALKDTEKKDSNYPPVRSLRMIDSISSGSEASSSIWHL